MVLLQFLDSVFPIEQDEKDRALSEAICAGHSEAVRTLVAHGADVNRQVHPRGPPLHCAVAAADFESVKWLVEAMEGGADVHAVWNGGTAAQSVSQFQDKGEKQTTRKTIAEYLDAQRMVNHRRRQ